jgi:hypothetical protein
MKMKQRTIRNIFFKEHEETIKKDSREEPWKMGKF